MSDQIASALIEKLQPVLYFIGLFVVLGITSFGGTLISIWYKSKNKKEDAITQALTQNTLAIARLESKLDIYIDKHEKNYNDLGKRIKSLSV